MASLCLVVALLITGSSSCFLSVVHDALENNEKKTANCEKRREI